MAQPLARPEFSELTLRVMSAAVILPLAIAAIWSGGWYFGGMVLLIAAAMGWELSRLCGTGPVLGLIVIAVLLLVAGLSFAGLPREGLACAIVGTIIAVAASRIGAVEAPNLFAAGVAYISLALLSIVWLRVAENAGLVPFCWMVAVVVATDIGAYFAGRGIGGPKLAPRVSPAKTWSGLAGGAVCAALAGALILAATGGGGYLWVVLASGTLAVVAQAGDLIESAVKRHVGVKDSGNFIPGHGGVLDRLDGFLTVAPVTALMTWIAGGSPLEWQ